MEFLNVMKVYFGDFEFEGKCVDNRIVIKCDELAQSQIDYFLEWMRETYRYQRVLDYKRDGRYDAIFLEGALLGCFPVCVNPDSVEISYDIVELNKKISR
jgi:hypothetical protein